MNGAVVLATGAASGIGLAVARACVTQGAQVWMWDRDPEVIAAAAALGEAARAVVVDIADEDGVAAAEAALVQLPPTHLVNNAGMVGRAMRFDAMVARDIERVLAVNITGTLLVTAAFLRAKATHPGAGIVNMASIAGLNGGAPGLAVYGATKGAIIALTSAMARDLAPALRVNALAPGIIDTGMQNEIFADRDAMQAQSAAIPLARIGTAEEVAEAAIWLLFGAPYVSGETIRVGGGRK